MSHTFGAANEDVYERAYLGSQNTVDGTSYGNTK